MTNANIVTKHTNVANTVPTPAILKVGELAINTEDLLIFTKKQNGDIVKLNVTEQQLNASVSTLMEAINLKVNILDIVDDLITADQDKVLSAKQGTVLKTHIDNINTILQSDDNTLDELQEIVNYIKLNKETLDNLSIGNIAGLETTLTNLQNQLNTHNHDGVYTKSDDYATETVGGTVKMRVEGTTLYITNDGTNP
jgi:hypothetical protein